LLIHLDHKDMEANALRIIKDDQDFLIIVGTIDQEKINIMTDEQKALAFYLAPYLLDGHEELLQSLREDLQAGARSVELNAISIASDYQRLNDDKLATGLLEACRSTSTNSIP